MAYTDAYCAYYLECADPALLNFDGLDDIVECKAIFGPGVGDSVTDCKLDKGSAKDCLDAMDALACPAEGFDVDAELPLVCESAWKKCEAGVPADVAQ